MGKLSCVFLTGETYEFSVTSWLRVGSQVSVCWFVPRLNMKRMKPTETVPRVPELIKKLQSLSMIIYTGLTVFEKSMGLAFLNLRRVPVPKLSRKINSTETSMTISMC